VKHVGFKLGVTEWGDLRALTTVHARESCIYWRWIIFDWRPVALAILIIT